MARGTVLVVDREGTRRRELARGLAELGYEVVAAGSAEEGRRFEAGIAPDAVVAEAALADARPPGRRGALSIVLASAVGEGQRAGCNVVPAGLSLQDVLGRLRVALLAHEVGVAAEPDLTALAGELRDLPLLELMPRLRSAAVSGRVVVAEGEIAVDRGEVAGCAAGQARGAKAFARMARAAAGRFRVVLGAGGGPSEVGTDLLSLMALAMEDGPRFDDAAGRLPDLASRVRIVVGPAFPGAEFNAVQRLLLAPPPGGESVWDAIDRVAEPDGRVVEELGSLAEMGVVAFDPPEVGVRIVTDSTADVPAALAERYGVVVVPASVTLGGEPFGEGVRPGPGELSNMLAHGRGLAVEARPPSRDEFLAVYRGAVARADVVSVHASAKLSDTFEHARAAAEAGREDFRRVRGSGTPCVEVVDSALVSTPLALLVTVAARLAAHRLPAAEIRARLDAMKGRVRVLFALDHPDYIARSGSAGPISSFLGGLLGMRPILCVRDGEIAAVERVRGEGNVPGRLVELLNEGAEPGRPALAGIGHTTAPQAAVRLRSLLYQQFKVVELLENEIGPAVGLHVGPGCLGVALLQPTDEELALIGPA